MKLKSFLILLLLLIVSIMAFGCDENNESQNSQNENSFSESKYESLEFSEESQISDDLSMEDEVTKGHSGFIDPLVVGFEKIQNPFMETASDPFIMKHEGKYYYVYSTGTSIYVSTFNSLSDASLKGAKCVFSPMKGTEYSSDVWAPELHFIDGSWYIYFAACDGENENHRMYVLKSKTDDPMGEYDFIGKITDSTDKWAIDGTVFTYGGEMYFLWSGWMGNKNVAQQIYIAKMSSPTQLSSERVCISVPTYRWETRGGRPKVNEGPTVITDGEYLSIVYSASGSWCDDYCLGQLIFKGGNVLEAMNWRKHNEPILKKDENRFFGPGHCSIVSDENGVLWVVFHANLESETGWNGRSGWMYPIRINENGIVEVVFYD